MDDKTGKLWVLKKKTDTVGLIVNHLNDPHDLFPSFQDLQDKHFPASLIDGTKLLPESVTAKSLFSPHGDNGDKDTIISSSSLTSSEEASLYASQCIIHALTDLDVMDSFHNAPKIRKPSVKICH